MRHWFTGTRLSKIKSLSISSVSEGVETPDHWDTLLVTVCNDKGYFGTQWRVIWKRGSNAQLTIPSTRLWGVSPRPGQPLHVPANLWSPSWLMWFVGGSRRIWARDGGRENFGQGREKSPRKWGSELRGQDFLRTWALCVCLTSSSFSLMGPSNYPGSSPERFSCSTSPRQRRFPHRKKKKILGMWKIEET